MLWVTTSSIILIVVVSLQHHRRARAKHLVSASGAWLEDGGLEALWNTAASVLPGLDHARKASQSLISSTRIGTSADQPLCARIEAQPQERRSMRRGERARAWKVGTRRGLVMMYAGMGGRRGLCWEETLPALQQVQDARPRQTRCVATRWVATCGHRPPTAGPSAAFNLSITATKPIPCRQACRCGPVVPDAGLAAARSASWKLAVLHPPLRQIL